MKMDTYTNGQHYYQAQITRNGRDYATGDCFTVREEAESDGAEMAAGSDPEAQKRGVKFDFFVREYVVDSCLGADGENAESGEFGSSRTVD